MGDEAPEGGDAAGDQGLHAAPAPAPAPEQPAPVSPSDEPEDPEELLRSIVGSGETTDAPSREGSYRWR